MNVWHVANIYAHAWDNYCKTLAHDEGNKIIMPPLALFGVQPPHCQVMSILHITKMQNRKLLVQIIIIVLFYSLMNFFKTL